MTLDGQQNSTLIKIRVQDIMDKNEFKKIVTETLGSHGFTKKGSYYYKTNEDLIFVIGLQKSNYSEAFYINVAYILKQLQPDLTNPKDFEGDFRARFLLDPIGSTRVGGLFDLTQLSDNSKSELVSTLEENIKYFIDPASSLEGLKELIKNIPSLLNQGKFTAKQFLGLN